MVSKACLVGTYQTKLEAIARYPDIDLTVIVPPEWRDAAGTIQLEREHTQGYRLIVDPIRLNGHFHFHYYPQLKRRLGELRPHIVHLDEEPYNLATWMGWRQARAVGAKTLFFSWQNLYNRYPFPFSWMERQVLQGVDYALMGNEAQGLPPEVAAAVDVCVTIPMAPGVDSFSVNAAAAIVLYELQR